MRLKKILAAAMTCGMLLSFIPSTAMAATAGWQGSDSSGWRYCTSDGSYVKNAWKQIGGKWYYFGEDGYAFLDTWAFIDGKLYHFGKSGAMDKNKWIECGDHLAMYEEEADLKDYRYVGSDGAAYTGWKQIGGKWYYFYTNPDFYTDGTTYYGAGGTIYMDITIFYGLMAYGEVQFDEDTQYYFDRSGEMAVNRWYVSSLGNKYVGSDGKAVSGWQKINGKWYYFDDIEYMYNVLVSRAIIIDHGKAYNKDGSLASGLCNVYGKNYVYCNPDGTLWCNKWLNKDGAWYYFNGDGNMLYDAKDYFIEGKFYTFDSDGKCSNFSISTSNRKGWYPESSKKEELGPYYYGTDGKAYYSQWLTYSGNKYYFGSNGKKLTNIEDIIDGKLYSFDKTGKCTTPDGVTEKGWYKGVYDWFYIGSDGKLRSGWQKISGKWYYFDRHSLIMNTEKQINGKYYCFDSNGAMKTGWVQDKYGWKYYGADGALCQHKWLYSSGSWYYLADMYMVSDTEYFIINGRAYNFDANGKCLNPSGSTFKFDT